MEEKAEVKIKNRGSARMVQTGAAAITAEHYSKTPLAGPRRYCGRARTLGLVLIEINFTSTILCKVLQLTENQMKLL